jgi:hypothetical protein
MHSFVARKLEGIWGIYSTNTIANVKISQRNELTHAMGNKYIKQISEEARIINKIFFLRRVLPTWIHA